MQKLSYFDFENSFRGSRTAIINRLLSYKPLIESISRLVPRPNLLDVGCGRGEILETFTSFGFHSLGIDSNEEMVKFNQNKGRNVILGDALECLSTLSENSYDVITIFHLIEHCRPNYIYNLLKECQRLLKNNGVILLETPSIDNIEVATRTFYLDSTHINPINPENILYNLKMAGFCRPEYYYVNPSDENEYTNYSLESIFKGVAQDLFVIAYASQICYERINMTKDIWYKALNIGCSTSEAIMAFDKQLLQDKSILDNFKLEFKFLYNSNLELTSKLSRFEKSKVLMFILFVEKIILILFKLLMKIFNNRYFYHLFRPRLTIKKIYKKYFFNIDIFHPKILNLYNKLFSKRGKYLNVTQKFRENKYLSYFKSSPHAQLIYSRLEKRKNFLNKK